MKIELLVLDVDGVLTDGGVYYSERGEEMVKFNRRDGMGISLLQKSGVEVAIISGENSNATRKRAEKLKITKLHLGVSNKKLVLENLLHELRMPLEKVAYIGDDINDIEAMEIVGHSMTVSDGHKRVREIAKHILSSVGGKGAVREAADFILALNDVLVENQEPFP